MRITLTLFVATLLSHLGHAALGENLQQSPQPQRRHERVKTFQRGKLRVRETESKKLRLRELADQDGNIFALSWSGRSHPDMAQVMGVELVQYRAALRAARLRHRGHGPLVINHGNFHLELAGNMRAMVGRAWLTNKIPEGVATHEIR